MRYYVYVLKDPRFIGIEAIRYVGSTTVSKFKRRLEGHVSGARTNSGARRDPWI